MESHPNTETVASGDVSLKDILAVINRQNQSFESFQSKVSVELSSIKQEVHGSSSQVKKLKYDSQVKWRSEGHRIQFTFNTELCEELEQVDWAIDNDKIDYAKEIVSSVAEKLKRRNKLIKIADSSEGGWETVRQYESNPVASDSEDEGKINRAENRAIKKRKSTKKSKSSADKSDHNVSVAAMPPHLFRGPQWFGGPQPFPFGQGAFRGPAPGAGRRGGTGACYSCGSFAHWRNECPFYVPGNKSSASAKGKPE